MALFNGALFNRQGYNRSAAAAAAPKTVTIAPAAAYGAFLGLLNSRPFNTAALNQVTAQSSSPGMAGAGSMSANLTTSNTLSATMNGVGTMTVSSGTILTLQANMDGSGSLTASFTGSVVVVSTLQTSRFGVLNTLTLNSAPYNGLLGRSGGSGMGGSGTMNVTFGTVLNLQLVQPSSVGVLNSQPLNTLVLNGGFAYNSTGGARMSAALQPNIVPITASLSGGVFMGKIIGPPGTKYRGGYNAHAFRSVTYKAAVYDGLLIDIFTGLILTAQMSGQADFTPKPWLQSYNPLQMGNGQESDPLYSDDRNSVFLTAA